MRFRREGGQVLIGTPGRLSDFMKRCTALDARRLEVQSDHLMRNRKVSHRCRRFLY